MLANPTRWEYVLIRASIFIIRYLGLWCLLYFILAAAIGRVRVIRHPASLVIEAIGLIEICFYLFWFLPYKRYLQRPGIFPPPLSRAERSALFFRCLSLVPDMEWFLRGWNQTAPLEDIGREDRKDWLLWAIFEREGLPGDDNEELEEYLIAVEEKTGIKLKPGHGKAKPLRLNFEPVNMTHRNFFFYLVSNIALAGSTMVYENINSQSLTRYSGLRTQ